MVRWLALCSSSVVMIVGCAAKTPPAPSAGERCFAGAYAVSFGAPDGDAACPDLSSAAPTWVVNVDGAGNVLAPAPVGASPVPGSSFDAAACRASYAFTRDADACSGETYAYDLSFDASGFSGTYTYAACGLRCAYPIRGARR